MKSEIARPIGVPATSGRAIARAMRARPNAPGAADGVSADCICRPSATIDVAVAALTAIATATCARRASITNSGHAPRSAPRSPSNHATNQTVGVQNVSVGKASTPSCAGGAKIVIRNASEATTKRNCRPEPAAAAMRGPPAIATAPRIATTAENTNAAPAVVTIAHATKCTTAARNPN